MTRSEYERHVKAAREEMVPASELAEILVEGHDWRISPSASRLESSPAKAAASAGGPLTACSGRGSRASMRGMLGECCGSTWPTTTVVGHTAH